MSAPTPTLFSLGRLPVAVDLAEKLLSGLAWSPRYWITQPELEDAVAQRFPDAVRHDFTDANRGSSAMPSDALIAADVREMLQDGLLLQLAGQIVSRHVLANALSHDQQMAFLTDRLEYCLRVVRTLQLEVFVLNATPHSVIDFCFYYVFKRLGLRVRMLHLSGHNGVQVVLDDACESPRGIEGQPANDGALSPGGEAAIAKLLDKQQDLTPWYVKNQNAADQKYARLYRIADRILDRGWHKPGDVDFDAPAMIPTKIKRFFRTIKQIEYVDAFGRTFQKHQDEPMRRAFAYRPEGFGAPPITWKQYYTYRDWMLLEKRQGKRDYERLTAGFATDDATTTRFVYFPLHYQPERTTCPEGGSFADQILAVRTLATALPDGWRLWVKEHPSQFLWKTEGELGRWLGYYDSLAAIDGVDLVPLTVSSDQLIETCQAVATITGTVGWEARVRGKPVVALANPWYAQCRGIQRATTPDEIARAFRAVQDGIALDEADLRPFLAVLEKVGRRCYLNPSHQPLYSDLTEEQNLENLADLFISSEKAP